MGIEDIQKRWIKINIEEAKHELRSITVCLWHDNM